MTAKKMRNPSQNSVCANLPLIKDFGGKPAVHQGKKKAVGVDCMYATNKISLMIYDTASITTTNFVY